MAALIGSGLLFDAAVAPAQNAYSQPLNIAGKKQITYKMLSGHGNHIQVEYADTDETGPYYPSVNFSNVALAAGTAKMMTETVDAVWVRCKVLDAGETTLTVDAKTKELR